MQKKTTFHATVITCGMSRFCLTVFEHHCDIIKKLHLLDANSLVLSLIVTPHIFPCIALFVIDYSKDAKSNTPGHSIN